MICSACGFENTASAKFCSECGARLTAPAGERSAREERKVVSVLFADLVGFTGRAERLDPEDVRAVLGPYHTRLRDEIERHGGTVEKFIGDAVVGVFGAPVAHEDDPERAVRAALAIRDWALGDSADLELRIAVNTGEALVNLDARAELGEGMVSGDVVNTAARLQTAAPTNGVLVGEQTFRATRAEIEYRDAEPIVAKGKAEPVSVWEAVQARSRLGVDLADARHTELVGRQRERALLVDALARAREAAEPQLVTIVGVPGIGKTRLLGELFQAVEHSPGLTVWRQGRSLPYGTGVAFWALAEIVKAQAGVLETDNALQAAAKLRETVRALIAEPGEGEWVEGHLRPLVGVAGDPEVGGARRDEAFGAWRRFLEALAEQDPTVLVFEDLQWADDGLLDFIDQLVEWAAGVPLLVVCATRPELLSRRPGWGGGKANASTISLTPLSEQETAHLLALLLDQPVLPAELQAAVLQRAEGNPLFAEEYVRMLQDRGFLKRDGSSWRLVAADELPLPETVHGTIAARLDALDEEAKLLIQDAAVFGKVFWVGALIALGDRERSGVEQSLHALERRELVQRARRPSLAGETEYAFRHALVRDVAYGQMPRPRRAETHRLAASWIESLQRPEDHADMVAYHYLAALEFAEAAGLESDELLPHARAALTAAGDRAFALNAFAPATQFYAEALSRTPPDAPERAQLLFRLGRARYYGEAAGEQALTEAAAGLLAEGDAESGAEAVLLLGEIAFLQGQGEGGFAHLRRAVSLVEQRPSTPSKARVVSLFARRLGLAGRYAEARNVAEEALAIALEVGTAEAELHARNTLATVLTVGGDDAGLAEYDRALDLAKGTPTPDAIRVYGNYGSVLHELRGDLGRARELQEEALRLARRFGVGVDVDWMRAELAIHRYHSGDWAEALSEIDVLLRQFEQVPNFMESPLRSMRGQMLQARGDVAAAYSETKRALALAREGIDPQLVYPALAFHARTALAAGHADEARLLVDELAQLERGEREFFRSLWFLVLTMALIELGRTQDADELARAARTQTPWIEAVLACVEGRLPEAAERLERIGALPDAAYIHLRAGQALLEEHRREEAGEQLARAVAFFRSVGATAYLEEAEPLLGAA